MNRVVVTGIGVVSPVGNGCGGFWRGLLEGRSGVGPLTLFDASTFPVRIGGEVKGLDTGGLEARFPEARGERDRKVWLGLAAAEEALADAALAAGDLHEAALHVGVGLEVFFLEDVAGIAEAADPARAAGVFSVAPDSQSRVPRLACQAVRYIGQHGLASNPWHPAGVTLNPARAAGVLVDGPAGVQPLQTPLDRLGQVLGDHYGIFGGRYTNCSACAAGAMVIGEAFERLRDGEAEVAIAGAADSMLNPLGVGGFGLLRVLSAENDRPQEACRPFDATRQGTVLGEGAAFVVLETLDRARRRGARVYAEVLGYGCSMDAFRVSDPEPSGRGAVLSMARALADAGLRPDAIDCASAHGTGTPKNDVVETAAIKEVLGEQARRIPVHAVKSMTGHMIAASGAAEAVAAVLTLAEGAVPPTINLRTPDPECDLDYVADGPRPMTGRTVLSNSFGFGGQNATLIFGRHDA